MRFKSVEQRSRVLASGGRRHQPGLPIPFRQLPAKSNLLALEQHHRSRDVPAKPAGRGFAVVAQEVKMRNSADHGGAGGHQDLHHIGQRHDRGRSRRYPDHVEHHYPDRCSGARSDQLGRLAEPCRSRRSRRPHAAPPSMRGRFRRRYPASAISPAAPIPARWKLSAAPSPSFNGQAESLMTHQRGNSRSRCAA